MTVRPPTLRDKRRYVLVKVDPPGTVIDQKELYYAVSDAVTSLWGDSVAGVIVQAVIGKSFNRLTNANLAFARSMSGAGYDCMKASTAAATTSAAGLMSAADKVRLNALELAALTIASIESY